VFLGLLDPDPDPLVRGMDPDPTLDPSIIKQKSGSGSTPKCHGSATLFISIFILFSLSGIILWEANRIITKNVK
jgi:hypothetical protein